MTDPARLEVGHIAKPHGLRGQVIVQLVTDRPERTVPGAVLYAGDRAMEVVAAQPHGGRWLVSFAGVHSREAAEALAGTVLFGEPIEDEEALWVHDLIGSRVVEAAGTERGRVVAVVANPAHDLLELDDGALVPVVFVRSSADGVVVIDPPDGLFN